MPARINIPPLTRVLLGFLALCSLWGGAIRYARWTRPQAGDGHEMGEIIVPSLAIVPQYVLFRPWVLLTAPLVELNLFTLLISGATIFYGGKYLERAWSSAEFAKFILVVSLAPNVLTTATIMLVYAVTLKEQTLYAGLSHCARFG